MRNHYLLPVVVAVLVLFLGACGAQESSSPPEQGSNVQNEGGGAEQNEETIELSYAFFAPANTFPAVQMEIWKEEVEKRTNGKVKVNLFPGGTLLQADNMYEGVKNGIADIGLSSTTYEPGKYPLLSISDMPAGYKNATVASKVVYELIKEFPPEAFQDFKIITAFATEPAYIQSKTKIASLEDLKGKQLRSAGDTLEILERLGAAPVGMSQSEVPEALQTGIIEGYVSSREILKDLKLAEMVKYQTDYPLTIYTFVAVMTKEKWESLPADVQRVIDELSEEMMLFTGDYLDRHVQEALNWAQNEHGFEIVSLNDEEKQKWDEIISQMRQERVEKLKQEGYPAEAYLAKLNELVEKYNNE